MAAVKGMTTKPDEVAIRNSLAKLTPAQVMAIRNLKGRAYQRDIAKQFGVCQRTINKILCGVSYVPAVTQLNNSSGGPKLCAAPGCKKKLRADKRSPLRLMADTVSYCTKHAGLGLPSHYRALAKAAMRQKCREPNCEMLGWKNLGYCAAHQLVRDRPSCAKPKLCKKCSAVLGKGRLNRSDYCRKCRNLVHEKKKGWRDCTAPGCTEKINSRNKLGYCDRHRGRSPKRQAGNKIRSARFLAKQKAKLAEGEKVPQLELELMQVKEKLRRRKVPAETKPAKIRREIAAEMPGFRQLLAAPQNLAAVRKGLPVEGFSKEQIEAAREAIAVGDSKAWPLVAARHYVAVKNDMEYSSVASYDKPSRRLLAS